MKIIIRRINNSYFSRFSSSVNRNKNQKHSSKNNFDFSTSFQNVSFFVNACDPRCRHSKSVLSRNASSDKITKIKPSSSFICNSLVAENPYLSAVNSNVSNLRGKNVVKSF